MSQRLRFLVLLHAVLVAAGMSSATMAQSSSAEAHTVSGAVTDMNNEALANVRVELYRNGTLVDAAQTGSDGSYEISFEKGEPIDLKFIEPGHDDASFIGLAGASSQVINKTLYKKGMGPSVASAGSAASESDKLPNAKTGECYAQVLVPAKYSDKTLKVLQQDASEKIEIVPAKYEEVEEKVLVEPAIEKLKVIPAKYKTETHRVQIKPEQKKFVAVPPVYETVSEKVLVKPAYKTWKKGRGPIEKVDNATGEIMCLVEIPAQYATIEKRVLKKPASTRIETIPAEYKTIQRKVVVEERKVEKTTIPAKYETVKVWKEASPAETKRIPVPAKYGTITQPVKVSEESIQWQQILCKTNTTPGIVKRIQKALRKAGFNPGSIDGALGAETLAAVRAYQKKKGLAAGEITIKTLESLGVSVSSG